MYQSKNQQNVFAPDNVDYPVVDNTDYGQQILTTDDIIRALTELIEERCNYLIVILTNAFLRSAENKFLVDFTQALQIEQKTRKIIPLLYESFIDISRTLNIYTNLRYNTSSVGFCDYWTKLANSIRNVGMVVETTQKIAIYRNEIYRTPTRTSRQLTDVPQQNVNCLPSPPTEIPSINLNGNALDPVDSNDRPRKVERSKFRALTMRHNRSNPAIIWNTSLRNAHSTGQLHTSYQNQNMSSISNISTTSESKKKKKWSNILSKVFSRSSTKLQQETA